MKNSNLLITALCAGLLVSGFAAAGVAPTTVLVYTDGLQGYHGGVGSINYLGNTYSSCGTNCTKELLTGISGFPTGTMELTVEASGGLCYGSTTINFQVNQSVETLDVSTQPGTYPIHVGGVFCPSFSTNFTATVTGDVTNGYVIRFAQVNEK